LTIERSHGKARPTLPRSGDLRVVETAATPTEGRAPGGRFAPGNQVASGGRWKASIRKLLGDGSSAQAEPVARAAFRLYCALLRELPSDGPSVRSLAALQARHAALAAHFTDRADELGFETEKGAAALELATKHGQRAERLAVTALDVATKLRAAKPTKSNVLALIEADPVEEPPARHGDELSSADVSETATPGDDASAGQTSGASAGGEP
jgi:hypothetical protein